MMPSLLVKRGCLCPYLEILSKTGRGFLPVPILSHAGACEPRESCIFYVFTFVIAINQWPIIGAAAVSRYHSTVRKW